MDLRAPRDHAVRRRAAHKPAAEEMRGRRRENDDEQDGGKNHDAPITALLLQILPSFPAAGKQTPPSAPWPCNLST